VREPKSKLLPYPETVESQEASPPYTPKIKSPKMHSFITSGKIGRYLPIFTMFTMFCCFLLLNWPRKTYDGSDFLDVPLVPASTLSTLPTPSTSASIFDALHIFAHGAAIDHASRSGMLWERKRFDRDSLLNWKRKDGGL